MCFAATAATVLLSVRDLLFRSRLCCDLTSVGPPGLDSSNTFLHLMKLHPPLSI